MTTLSLPQDQYLNEVSSVPIYTMSEAAEIVQVSPSTFRNWALGYSYKRGASQNYSSSLVQLAGPPGGRRPSVPFVGLAEGYMLAAFTRAGVPMQRIRPAVDWLRQHMGLENALASEKLCTDGAEVLYEYGRISDDRADAELVDMLVVVRNQQGVFRPVVQKYLRTVTYRDGLVSLIKPQGYGVTEVVVSPWINFGAPSVASRRIRVADIVNRVEAGEAIEEVAYDYGLKPDEVHDVVSRPKRVVNAH